MTRGLVVERGLVPAAFAHLTEAFMALPFEALGPTKTLLKRFFSAEPWGPADDEALAAAVGPGQGTWSRPLDADLTLEYGWEDGRFGVRVLSSSGRESTPTLASAPPDEEWGPVVPEATPNPRSIRFRLEEEGEPGQGPSRWYESVEAAHAAGDARAIRLFGTFEEVANVLVGPGFVNVSLRRAADWERLLDPVLAVVTDEFAGAGDDGGGAAAGEVPTAGRGPVARASPRHQSRLEQAWKELGTLRPAEDAVDLSTLEAAARGDDPFRRQVAANLLREADPAAAAALWADLVTDPSRAVRRATVDAMVDAGKEELRPLLELALKDDDAWIRWKALRGLAELGADESREAVAALAEDADFRVRLEVAAALRSPRPGSGPGSR